MGLIWFNFFGVLFSVVEVGGIWIFYVDDLVIGWGSVVVGGW